MDSWISKLQDIMPYSRGDVEVGDRLLEYRPLKNSHILTNKPRVYSTVSNGTTISEQNLTSDADATGNKNVTDKTDTECGPPVDIVLSKVLPKRLLIHVEKPIYPFTFKFSSKCGSFTCKVKVFDKQVALFKCIGRDQKGNTKWSERRWFNLEKKECACSHEGYQDSDTSLDSEKKDLKSLGTTTFYKRCPDNPESFALHPIDTKSKHEPSRRHDSTPIKPSIIPDQMADNEPDQNFIIDTEGSTVNVRSKIQHANCKENDEKGILATPGCCNDKGCQTLAFCENPNLTQGVSQKAVNSGYYGVWQDNTSVAIDSSLKASKTFALDAKEMQSCNQLIETEEFSVAEKLKRLYIGSPTSLVHEQADDDIKPNYANGWKDTPDVNKFKEQGTGSSFMVVNKTQPIVKRKNSNTWKGNGLTAENLNTKCAGPSTSNSNVTHSSNTCGNDTAADNSKFIESSPSTHKKPDVNNNMHCINPCKGNVCVAEKTKYPMSSVSLLHKPDDNINNGRKINSSITEKTQSKCIGSSTWIIHKEQNFDTNTHYSNAGQVNDFEIDQSKSNPNSLMHKKQDATLNTDNFNVWQDKQDLRGQTQFSNKKWQGVNKLNSQSGTARSKSVHFSETPRVHRPVDFVSMLCKD